MNFDFLSKFAVGRLEVPGYLGCFWSTGMHFFSMEQGFFLQTACMTLIWCRLVFHGNLMTQKRFEHWNILSKDGCLGIVRCCLVGTRMTDYENPSKATSIHQLHGEDIYFALLTHSSLVELWGFSNFQPEVDQIMELNTYPQQETESNIFLFKT